MSQTIIKKIRKNGREISRGGKILVKKFIVKTGYGALYNWFAVEESITKGGFITGYHVPNDAEWTTLTGYIQAQIDASVLPDVGRGNILKSCRQVDSPLGGLCNTEVHPRWDADATEYGRDNVKFSATPSGFSGISGSFNVIGQRTLWWSSTAISDTSSYTREVNYDQDGVLRTAFGKLSGFSVRCLRTAELTSAESALADGTRISIVQDYNGNSYEVIKIGTQAWLQQNIRCTNYADGTAIPNVTDNTDWSNLTTGAYVWYNNDINTAGIVYTDEAIV